MPVLNWIGKDAVVRHDAEVPFRLLQDVPELGCGDADSGNLIVEGDNLLALKALLPHYGGQVKCIYIDPPYNTGQDDRDDSGKRSGWVYNDNVNSPQMRDWLGKVVGEEAEDLTRHDKWLCMMYPRLKLLRQFLRDDGVIFASIDDIELASLRMLFDEIFGIGNRVGTIVWKNVTDNNPTQIAVEHEYAKDYRSKLSSLFELDGRIGTNEIKAIFPESKRPFDFPKPVELVEELLSFTTNGDDIVLDSFAGSGTTGQAVLSLNRADGQRRRFVLTEMKPSIAREITSERIRRVSQGYTRGKGDNMPGLGGGFRYAKLGHELFTAGGRINTEVKFADLARFVWFMETGTPLPTKRPASPLLGVHAGRAIYLLYNGILKDKSVGGGNVLTSPLLAELPPHDGPKTIYGTRCPIMPERRRTLRIDFKQLPHQIKVAR